MLAPETPGVHNDVRLLLLDLDPDQERVAVYEGPPLLVLASPGSGKTRVMAHRVAVQGRLRTVVPERVLAVTFTRAAATEMRDRVASIIGSEAPLHVGTFHWVCHGLLRRYIHHLGYRNDFTILAPSHSRAALERAVGPTTAPASSVLSAISDIHNGVALEVAAQSRDLAPEYLERVHRRYRDYKRKQSLVDLDDLQTLSLMLLREHQRIRDRCRRAHDEILVDEYQDVNAVQRDLLELLLPPTRRLVAVGDDDQAIYGWRHAIPEAAAGFRDRFQDSRLLTLTRNYRSTKHMVRAANALIAHNTHRTPKKMVTANAAGAPVTLIVGRDEGDEAARIASTIIGGYERWRASWDDFAVLFRLNVQSRAIEEAMIQQGIPYHVGSRYRFYERPEVRQACAYLRLALDASDEDAAALLLLSIPGIGEHTMERMRVRSSGEPGGLVEHLASGLPLLRERPLARRAAERIRDQLNWVQEARTQSLDCVVDRAVRSAGRDLGMGDRDAIDGDGYLSDLVSLAAEMQCRRGTLRELVDKLHRRPAEHVESGVALLSLHAAKGLEFRFVFLAGLEEGLLPYRRALADESGLEEERRLCFVGMTRAREALYLTHASSRTLHGESRRSRRSRFVGEIGRDNWRRAVAQRTEGTHRLLRAPEETELR